MFQPAFELAMGTGVPIMGRKYPETIVLSTLMIGFVVTKYLCQGMKTIALTMAEQKRVEVIQRVFRGEVTMAPAPKLARPRIRQYQN